MSQMSTLKLSKNGNFLIKDVDGMSTHFQINMNISVWCPGYNKLIYFGQLKIELGETIANKINNI